MLFPPILGPVMIFKFLSVEANYKHKQNLRLHDISSKIKDRSIVESSYFLPCNN